MDRVSKAQMNERVADVQVSDCNHRSHDIGRRTSTGCALHRTQVIIFRCNIHGTASERKRVTIPGSRRPDKLVKLCLGCPDYKAKD